MYSHKDKWIYVCTEGIMNERDKRAVENMALCGISLEGLLGAFPKFPAEEVMEIYNKVNGNITLASPIEFKINCS